MNGVVGERMVEGDEGSFIILKGPPSLIIKTSPTSSFHHLLNLSALLISVFLPWQSPHYYCASLLFVCSRWYINPTQPVRTVGSSKNREDNEDNE